MRIPTIKVSVVRDGDDIELSSPSAVFETGMEVFKEYQAEEKEALYVFIMDNKNKLKGLNLVSIGTISESLVHPREVLRPALVAGATGIILGHNHPSENLDPSRDDITTTERIKEACKIMGINFIDHIIFGTGNYYSMREGGYL